MKGVDGVAGEPRIDRGEIGGGRKDDVGRILALPLAPIVRPQIPAGPAIEPRHHAPRPRGEQRGPVEGRQLVAVALRARKLGDRGEAIVTLRVGDAGAGQPPREPLATIHIHVDGQRQPRLHPHVHEAERPVDVIEIEMQALAFAGDRVDLFADAIPMDVVRATRFDARQHTDQAVGDAVARHDRAGDGFFAGGGGGHILERPTLRCAPAFPRAASPDPRPAAQTGQSLSARPVGSPGTPRGPPGN